jgi:hypothetical protein
LPPGVVVFYHITIEALADPTPIMSAEEQPDDLRAQIERVLAQLEGVSEQEALSQVYRRVRFTLCGPCYRRWIENPC